MIKRFLPIALPLALAAASPLAPEAHAQIHPGFHLARAAKSFDGVNGVGGSVELRLPVLPVSFVVAGEYFFPGCEGCSLWGGSVDVHLSLRLPGVSPYGAAGLVLRNTDVSDTRVRTGGVGLGGGVNLTALGVRPFAEARYEILDGSGEQLVFRLGLRL
jgi:hypothetical protein